MRLAGSATVLALVVLLLLGSSAGLAQTAASRTTVLVADDGGDVPYPQDDIQSFSVYENPNSTALVFNVTMSSTNGTTPDFQVDIFLTSAAGALRYSYGPQNGPAACGGHAKCSTDAADSRYTFHVPTSDLKSPGAGALLWNLSAATYEGVIVDRAPGQGAGFTNLASGDNVTYTMLGPVAWNVTATNLTANATAANESFQSTSGAPASSSGNGVPGFPAAAALLAALAAAVVLRRR